MTFQALFTIAIFYEQSIKQMNVKTIFLHGMIHQKISIGMPKTHESQEKNRVYSLKKRCMTKNSCFVFGING